MCDKRFAVPNDLATHMRLHTVEKKHECTVCGMVFKYLNKHRRLVHDSEGLYACDRCQKTFTNRRRFKEHAKHHSMERSHICSRKDSIGLKIHTRVHTGERPFMCKCFKNRQASSISMLQFTLAPSQSSVQYQDPHENAHLRQRMIIIPFPHYFVIKIILFSPVNNR